MRILIAILSLVTISSSSFAMPCDTGYICTSKSGKYIVEFQRCRYRNSLNLSDVKIAGIDLKSATQGPSWDGNKFLAFEIALPTKAYARRTLSAETVKSPKDDSIKGTVQESVSDDGISSKVIQSEPISCEIED